MRLNLGVISQLSNISYKIVIVLHAYHTIVILLLISETIGLVRLIFFVNLQKMLKLLSPNMRYSVGFITECIRPQTFDSNA